MKILTVNLIIILGFSLPELCQTDISFQNELQRSIDRGIDFLKKSQSPGGYWTNADHPAVTAIALVAYQGNPQKLKAPPDWVEQGYQSILKHVQPNGSIYVPNKGLANYNTALSMMAMLASGDAKFNSPILNAAVELPPVISIG